MMPPAAQAQSNGLAKSDGDQHQFVVGDWYDVTIERHDVKEQGFGMLVKSTDDWIVLGKVVAAGIDVESGVPYLRELPLIGRMFGKTVRHEVMSKHYVWIPRDAVHVDLRQTVTSERVKKEFRDDAPELAGECDVHFVAKGDRAEDGGEYVGISEGKARFARSVTESATIADPKWGGVPLIGNMLAKTKWVQRKVERQVPLEDVLYLVTQVDLTPEQVKLVNSN
jgi:hypothetical protein